MLYPLPSEYIESIKYSTRNLSSLSSLVPAKSENGDLIIVYQNHCMIFKMQDESTGDDYAILCFLEDNIYREKIYNNLFNIKDIYIPTDVHFLNKELFVDSIVSDEDEFPVIVYKWKDFVTLEEYINMHKHDNHNMQVLASNLSDIFVGLYSNGLHFNVFDTSSLVVSLEGDVCCLNFNDSLDLTGNTNPVDTDVVLSWLLVLLSLRLLSIDSKWYSIISKHDLLFGKNANKSNITNDLLCEFLSVDDIDVNKLVGEILIFLNVKTWNNQVHDLFTISHSFNDILEELMFYAKRGNSNKQIELAHYYCENGIFDKAFEWFKKASILDNPDGWNGLGYCYQNGYGVEKDLNKSFELFVKAADMGSQKAQYNLALAYFYGKGTLQNQSKAHRLFEITAEQGFPFSQYMVAYSYMRNQLGEISWHVTRERDTKKAFEWFKKAAEQNHGASQYEMGRFYESGTDPCVRNIEKAFEWYSKAASNGNSNAMFAIGRLYNNGLDVINPDFVKSFEYFLKAAELGHSEAQYNVGVALFYGKGVEVNKSSALEWLRKSCEQNNDSASSFLRKIELIENYEDVDDDEEEELDTMATNEDTMNAIMDDKGVLYSADGKKIIRFGLDDGNNYALFSFETSVFKPLKQQSFKRYVVPEGVEIICDEAFMKCESIEEIYLPKSLKAIGDRSFYKCKNLEEVHIQEGLEYIGTSAFNGCKALRSLILPNSLKEFAGNSFIGVHSIISHNPNYVVYDGCLYDKDKKILLYFFQDGRTHLDIPKGVEVIGWNSFERSKIKSINIPNTVIEIGYGAFEECLNLYSITIPDSVIKIEVTAFCCCRNLQIVKLSSKLEIIGIQAFDGCLNLFNIILPDSIRIIDNSAFAGTQLTTIHLPKMLEKLGLMAFGGTSLTKIEPCPNYSVIENVIYSADGKTLIQYYGNHKIFVIPDNVENIADCAFAYSYFDEISFPDSIKTIGNWIFEQAYPKKIKVSLKLKDVVSESIDELYRKNIEIVE